MLEQVGLGKQNRDRVDCVLFSTTVLRITHVAPRCSIQVLQQYFVEQGFSDTHHTLPRMCADKVFFWKTASKKINRLLGLVCGVATNILN